MLKKLGYVELFKAVQEVVEENTGLRCYDSIPKNAPSPFYFAEIVNVRPENTKTMFIDVFTVFIHAIAEPNKSSMDIYRLVQDLEEALTKEIKLCEEHWVLSQTSQGLNGIQTDETGEKHAVLAYEFKVVYGFKIKGGM